VQPLEGGTLLAISDARIDENDLIVDLEQPAMQRHDKLVYSGNPEIGCEPMFVGFEDRLVYFRKQLIRTM
jgi:hypothetical protein